jgi:hypothetical protein
MKRTSGRIYPELACRPERQIMPAKTVVTSWL